ncbi:MAG TPA: sigma-54 dependent transcriptional regulator, partial [Planctomycetaceae bacterium]|nr:sigma-54 dependent transcriptional regulator [Planctomycetaceae bacterium]
DGLTALEKLNESLGPTPVIIMTAFGNLETAVQAINRGAFEYLTKPFDLEKTIAVIRRALDSGRANTARLSSPRLAWGDDQVLLGESPSMQAVFRKIALVAEHDVPVLVTGESGTGKELVAEAIHRYSKRSSGPFIPICVPALNESIIESELFGHTRGAFTGAVANRQGLLELSNRGTAFFDEIGEISMAMQVKLLRVLESKAVTPTGGNETQRIDFRLVAATNQDLEAMVEQGIFRRDLYYRLNVFRIEMPSLRQRAEDIPLLAQHFVNRADPSGRVVLSQSTIDELMSRPWHGNVRELRNSIEHAVIVTRSGEIRPDALPSPIPLESDENLLKDSLAKAIREWCHKHLGKSSDDVEQSSLHELFLSEVEPVLFEAVLRASSGNRKEAARILGMHRQTLRERLKRYELDSSLD